MGLATLCSRRVASINGREIPRHPLPPRKPGTVSRRYCYYAPKVTEWLLSR